MTTYETLALDATMAWYRERLRFVATPEEGKILLGRTMDRLAMVIGSDRSTATRMVLKAATY